MTKVTAGAQYTLGSKDSLDQQKSLDSFSCMTRSGWLQGEPAAYFLGPTQLTSVRSPFRLQSRGCNRQGRRQ